MIRVLVLFEYGTLNGGENSLAALVEPLRRLGVTILAAAPAETPLSARLRALNVPVEPLVATHDSRALRDQLDTLRRRAPFDLLHSNSLAMSRRVGRFADDWPTPCLGHLRDILKLSARAVGDLNRNSRLLAVSMATKSFHVAQGLDATKCFVLHNGVDLDAFAPRRSRELARECGVADDSLVITTIGQLGMRKGLTDAVEAVSQVVANGHHVDWLVVGARHSAKAEAIAYERRLRTLGESPPLRNRLHWLGVRDDVPRILASTDVLLHAARQEPLGRVLLEAAACGLPVVATDVGGTREIFDTSQSALLCPPSESRALAAALERLLESPALRHALGEAARQRVEQAFDAQTSAARLAKHYHELIQATA